MEILGTVMLLLVGFGAGAVAAARHEATGGVVRRPLELPRLPVRCAARRCPVRRQPTE